MSNKAVSAWQTVLGHLAKAADTGTFAAANDACFDLQEVKSLQLPSAALKKLVKEHKVGLLVSKAFVTSSEKDPLSYATNAASAALQTFLTQARRIMCNVRAEQLLGPRSSSSSPAAGSLAAEVSRQLQQSGVLQALPRVLTAVAQQLEACAADPAVPAAAWQLSSQPGHWAAYSFSVQGQAQWLLSSFTHLMSLCGAEHARQLLAAAAPSAARTCLLLLRAIGAAMQLYDASGPTAGPVRRFLGEYVGTVQDCGLKLLASLHGGVDDPGLLREPWVQDTHVYELNVALAAAAAMKLQHDCSWGAFAGVSSTGSAAGSSGSSAGGCSSPGSGGLAAKQARLLNQGKDDPDDGIGAAAAWQLSCWVVASLGFELQLLFEQLGLDPRVATWSVCSCSYSTDLCARQAVMSAAVHKQLFMARAQRARQQLLPRHCARGQQQQQPGQQQAGQQQQQSDWPHELCLNLLLVSVMLPGRLKPQHMFAPIAGITPFNMYVRMATALKNLPADTRAAAAAAAADTAAAAAGAAAADAATAAADAAAAADDAAAAAAAAADDAAAAAADAAAPTHTGIQGPPLQACMQAVLNNLLLVSRSLAVLSWQQQHVPEAAAAAGSGTSSSGSGRGSGSSARGVHSNSHAASLADEVAAGTMLVAHTLYLIVQACIADLGPAAALVVEQGSEQRQQKSFVALLRPRLAEVLAHFDRCARVIAATIKVSTSGLSALSAGCLQSSLEACTGFLQTGASEVLQLGFDSQEQWQLCRLQASLLKMSAIIKNSNGSSGDSDSGNSTDDCEQLTYARVCTEGVAQIAVATALLQDGAEKTAATANADTAGRPNQQQQVSAATTAAQLVASLVLFGRACLQWAQELQAEAMEVQQGQQAGRGVIQSDVFSAADTCFRGFQSLSPQMTGALDTTLAYTSLLMLLDAFQAWLGKQHVSAQLTAAGYKPQELQQQLELLSSAQAAAAAAIAAEQQPLTQAVQPLVEQLQVVGTALSSLAVPAFCNNPACSNVSGPTELLLVSGRSCMCAGCRTARYCSRACSQQHWKAHKPVCQALAAAAAAAAAAAVEESPGGG